MHREYINQALTPEGIADEMIRNRLFIDKTQNYTKLINPTIQEHANKVLHLQFPRRFGKTTALSFFTHTLSDVSYSRHDPEMYRNFMRALNSLEAGQSYIRGRLRPSVRISFNGDCDDEKARTKVISSFNISGVPLRRKDKDGVKKTVGSLFEEGVRSLKRLWENAISKIPDAVKEHVSSQVLVVIDDSPRRAALSAGGSLEGATTKLEEMNLLTTTIKNMLNEGGLLGQVLIVSLMSISRIGLSDLESLETASSVNHFGVVGVTESDLRKALAALHRHPNDGFGTERLSPNKIHKCFNDCWSNNKLEYQELTIGCHTYWDYIKRRYNGFQFTHCTKDQFQRMESLFAPRDMYHFLYQLELSPAVDDWRESWVSDMLTFIVRLYSNTDTILEALVGGKISRKQLKMGLPIGKFFSGRNNRNGLYILLHEFGFLKIVGMEIDRYILIPSSHIFLDLMSSNCELLDEIARKPSSKLSNRQIEELQKTEKLYGNVPPGGFDRDLFGHLDKSSAFINVVATETKSDIFREYECQHYFMRILRNYLRPEDEKLNDLLHVIQERKQKFELHPNQSTDIFVKILSLAAVIESKILLGPLSENSSEAKRKLEHAWIQATNLGRHANKEHEKLFSTPSKTGYMVFYSIVFCVSDTGSVDVLLRRGAFRETEDIDPDYYEEYQRQSIANSLNVTPWTYVERPSTRKSEGIRQRVNYGEYDVDLRNGKRSKRNGTS